MQVLEYGKVYDAEAAPPERKCAAFTGLIALRDGSVLCSFKAGPQKVSSTDNVIIKRSADQGRTWSVLCDGFPTTWNGVPGSLSSGYVYEPSPGKLMIALTWVDRSRPELPLANPATTGLLDMRVLLADSDDGGKIWSPLRELNMRPHPGVALTSEILQLDDGSLLLPYESWKDWDDVEGTQRAACRISPDGGRTWNEAVIMASHPRQELYYWDNRLAKDPHSGRVVTMYWTHDPQAGLDVEMTCQWSDPSGQYWSTPESTGIQGQIAQPVVLGPKSLLSVYVHRHDPPSIRAVISNDQGVTWDVANELVLYESGGGTEAGTSGPRLKADYWDDMYRWTFGHPKGVLLPDGTVLVAWYGGRPEALSIHCARIKV